MGKKRRDRSSQSGVLADEQGTILKDAPLRFALVYPSPYQVAMSSLGYQTLYRQLNAEPGVCCERAMLDGPRGSGLLRTLESGRPVAESTVVALSVATEAEVALAASALMRAGLPPLEEERRRQPGEWPLVIAGGPLTFADGRPLCALADVVFVGEAEDGLARLVELLQSGLWGEALLQALAELTGVVVSALQGAELGSLAVAAAHWLPACSAVITPHTEFGDMFLVEPARGCPRKCGFCVMAPSSFRTVPAETVLGCVPDSVRRVGLVGSALGDHPQLREMIRVLVESGRSVGLSSLRADRLDGALLDLLVAGGARSLTVAADGASERLRTLVRKRITADRLLDTARLARERGLRSLKLYAMIGLPTEEEADLLELAELTNAMAESLPISVALSPFVPKARTPLAEAAFLEPSLIRSRLRLLRAALGRGVEVRAASVRGAWLENAVARGGLPAGRAAVEAARHGCTFAAWKRALADQGVRGDGVPEPP